MRVLELRRGDGPREVGRAHGEEMRPLVAEIADIRTELCAAIGMFRNEAQVYETARKHLPVLERFDPDLHQELLGIAEGAATTPERVVVVNHYTDLRDLDPDSMSEDDCSAVYAKPEEGALLGQTWDMHGSAMPYVMMMRVPGGEGAPAAWVFTITGCLGMTGMNEHGVGITINNLKSTDATVGVVWPALVRRVLREESAEKGRDVILGARLGSGHHYLVADERRAFGLETSGQRKKVVFEEAAASYVHTNHCLDPELAEVTTVSPVSSTRDRYRLLTDSLTQRPVADRADLWRRLGSHDGYPKSVCTHVAGPDRPHDMLTCGALVMDLVAKNLWAAAGCVASSRPHVFTF